MLVTTQSTWFWKSRGQVASADGWNGFRAGRWLALDSCGCTRCDFKRKIQQASLWSWELGLVAIQAVSGEVFFFNDLLILHIHSGHLVQTRVVRHISKEIEAYVWWGGQTGRWKPAGWGLCAQTFCSGTAVPGVVLLGRFRRVQGDTKGDGLGRVGEGMHCSRGVHLQHYLAPAVDEPR